MKMKNFKRVLGLVLAAAMVLTACGQKPAANEKTSEAVSKTETSVSETESKETESVAATEETVVNKEDLPVISLYPANASLYSGEVTGYRSDYFAEHGFQMEVWAFSAEKSNAMMVSGDLPDIMYVQAGSDMFKTLVENEQIINYDDYSSSVIYAAMDDLVDGKYGKDGYTPVRGTDYWTDADKAEIKSYVEDAILGGAW